MFLRALEKFSHFCLVFKPINSSSPIFLLPSIDFSLPLPFSPFSNFSSSLWQPHKRWLCVAPPLSLCPSSPRVSNHTLQTSLAIVVCMIGVEPDSIPSLFHRCSAAFAPCTALVSGLERLGTLVKVLGSLFAPLSASRQPCVKALWWHRQEGFKPSTFLLQKRWE